MNPKELLTEIKDYADCADASYAMLHLIDENDERGFFDSALTPPLWLYADGIKLGYEIENKHIQSEPSKSLISKNKREVGELTAYAAIMEARFSLDRKIIKPDPKDRTKDSLPEKINTQAQVFVYRNQEDKEARDQEYLLALNFERHNRDTDKFRYHLSPRTKKFVSRYEVIHHIKNTSISGYSHTIFKDTSKKDNTYILTFRGTEVSGMQALKDLIFTDGMIALGLGIPQVISLINYSDSVLEHIRNKHGSDDFKIDIVGHSLGGHLAQCFCIFGQKKYIQKLYTYNGAGIGGIIGSLVNLFVRSIRLVFKLLIKGIKKLFGFGMTRKTLDNCSKALNLKNGTDGLIEECKNAQGQVEQKRLDECALNIKQASKGKTSIEIHHIETIAKPIPSEEEFWREGRQTLEPTRSLISDLGYKYGLNIKDKFDYKNTDKLHLIHIGELEKSYWDTSHFMYNIVWASYLYEHLMVNNEDIEELKGDIACVLDYLNSYTQILIDITHNNKLLLQGGANIKNEDQNHISVVLDEFFYILCKEGNYKDKHFNFIYKDKKEAFNIKEYQNINKFITPDSFLALEAIGVWIRILDKNAIQNIQINTSGYNLRSLFKFFPFKLENQDGKDMLTKANLHKSLPYNSNCFKCIINEDNQEFFQARKKQAINLIYENHCTSCYLNKNQSPKTNIGFNSASSTAFVNLEEKKFFIFANHQDVVDCNEIYERVASKIGVSLDMLQSYQVYVFLNSTHLIGANELPNNSLYFGELDEKGVIKQDLPSYYFSPSDESSGKGRLAIFYKNDELCLLNYSILENSLNIKLECLNKQSLEYKDLSLNTLKEQESTQTDKKQSIATLHALLENQNVECIHGGKVILKSSKGKSFKDNNIPLMLESDLLNSSIVGCPNTRAGISYPCTKVVSVKGSLSKKKVNGEFVILQELLSGSLTDKGVPLKVSFVPTKFKFDHSFELDKGVGGQSKESDLELQIAHFSILTPYRNLKDFYFSTSIYEKAKENLEFALYKSDQELQITFAPIQKGEDYKDLQFGSTLDEILEELKKDYAIELFSFRIFTLKIAYSIFEYILIIPKSIPNFILKQLKEVRQKEEIGFGYGFYADLNKSYTRKTYESLDIQGKVFMAPSGMEKMFLKVK